MPGIQVNEPLNPSSWTTSQQQEMYDALAVLLGVEPVEPGCDYPSMSDEELTESLHDLTTEMKSRPSAVTTVQESTQFGDDVVVTPVE